MTKVGVYAILRVHHAGLRRGRRAAGATSADALVVPRHSPRSCSAPGRDRRATAWRGCAAFLVVVSAGDAGRGGRARCGRLHRRCAVLPGPQHRGGGADVPGRRRHRPAAAGDRGPRRVRHPLAQPALLGALFLVGGGGGRRACRRCPASSARWRCSRRRWARPEGRVRGRAARQRLRRDVHAGARGQPWCSGRRTAARGETPVASGPGKARLSSLLAAAALGLMVFAGPVQRYTEATAQELPTRRRTSTACRRAAGGDARRRAVKRLLPAPVCATAAAAWLLLNNTLALGQVLMGAVARPWSCR